MRRFNLVRDVDISGISGTGIVTEGVEFTDGTVAMRWRGVTPSTGLYEDVSDVVAIHGHEGATRLV